MLKNNQETIKNETVKKLIEATEKLKESPVVEYFYDNPDKNPRLTGCRLMFDTMTEKFSLSWGMIDYDVSDDVKDEIVLHIFTSKDNQAKLINGPVKNFQSWMMEEVIPNYQSKLLEFVDGIDQVRELSCDGLCQVRANKKLVTNFARLGNQLSGLKVSWRDVQLSTLLYTLAFTVYDYTRTMNCPDDDYLPNIDNVVRIVKWAVEDANLSDTEKAQIAKMLKWVQEDFVEFFYSYGMRHHFEQLQELVEK